LKNFVELVDTLSRLKSENQIIHYLLEYFKSEVPDNDKDESLKLLLDITPTRLASTKQLRVYASEITCFSAWIIDRSVDETGNFLKAFSLLLYGVKDRNKLNFTDWLSKISNSKPGDDGAIKKLIIELSKCDPTERLFILKLITGTFKSPISQLTLHKALAEFFEVSVECISLRIFETQISLNNIKDPISVEQHVTPSSFPEIDLIENEEFASLGTPENYDAYGKIDGIFAEIVKHDNSIYLWSEKGEILNNKFPEIIESVKPLKNKVKLQGQIIPKKEHVSIDQLKGRIQKKSISIKEITEYPAAFEIWKNLTENQGADQFSKLPGFSVLKKIDFVDWMHLQKIHNSCRHQGFSGILLSDKNQQDKYYYCKATSFSINAILIYVELGSILNQGLKSLTFGVFNHKNETVPIAKVEDFGDELDLSEIMDFTKQNTLERFGPVRTIKPELVYELNFDGISESKRRKSGLALTNVQVHKKQNDPESVINHLEDIRELLQ